VYTTGSTGAMACTPLLSTLDPATVGKDRSSPKAQDLLLWWFPSPKFSQLISDMTGF